MTPHVRAGGAGENRREVRAFVTDPIYGEVEVTDAAIYSLLHQAAAAVEYAARALRDMGERPESEPFARTTNGFRALHMARWPVVGRELRALATLYDHRPLCETCGSRSHTTKECGGDCEG